MHFHDLVKMLFQYKYRADDGSSPVHIIEECIRSFYLTYIVKKGSALYPSFSNHVQQLVEGGLVTFWYEYIGYAITTHRRFLRSTVTNDMQKSLSLIDLQVAFIILFIGIFVAFILFIIEILVYNHQQAKYDYINWEQRMQSFLHFQHKYFQWIILLLTVYSNIIQLM